MHVESLHSVDSLVSGGNNINVSMKLKPGTYAAALFIVGHLN